MFELVHLILDPQLALLEAPDLQIVDIAGRVESRDHLVKVAMLDAQLQQTASDCGAVFDGRIRSTAMRKCSEARARSRLQFGHRIGASRARFSRVCCDRLRQPSIISARDRASARPHLKLNGESTPHVVP